MAKSGWPWLRTSRPWFRAFHGTANAARKIAPVALTAVVDEVQTEILTAAEHQNVPLSTVKWFLPELDAAEKKFVAERPLTTWSN